MQHIAFFCLLVCLTQVNAQEKIVPIQQNNVYNNTDIKAYHSKKIRVNLPFIEDFSYQGPYPDATLWEDNQAYINNTMSNNQITEGIASLDGLNENGRPYYPNQFSSGLADSLTSVSINLASYDSNSHVYLSFFYQPQGLGFAPESTDSLFLYFKNSSNQWLRVWEIRGNNMHPFKLVLLHVKDPQFLHSTFQFRFVNIASMNLNDDVWNIDYVKIDTNRNPADSIMNDVAFTTEPTSILNNYTSMPYRHFIINQANEISTQQDVRLRNFYTIANDVTVSLQASEIFSSTPIASQTLPMYNIAGKDIALQSLNAYNISYVPPTTKSKVVIRNKYFIPTIGANDLKRNDTIIRDAIFDNYFAYDDGSVEKAYFLLPTINYPAKTALQFTLNEPDTMRGLMIHFGAQVPTAAGKLFSIVLYKSLGSLGLNDSIILQEDLFKVQYETGYNGFSSYAFSAPPSLAAGTYYIGITQPANFGSDSIYYGLDVNTSSNLSKLSYNIDGTWYSSTAEGSVMMRPIVGQTFTPTGTKDFSKHEISIPLYPNPVHETLYVDNENIIACTLYSLDGKLVCHKTIQQGKVDFTDIPLGNYVVVFKDKTNHSFTKKINKL